MQAWQGSPSKVPWTNHHPANPEADSHICESPTDQTEVHSGKESACQRRRHKRHRFDPWVGNKEVATHSDILTWKISWTEEPGATVQSQTRLSARTHTDRGWKNYPAELSSKVERN